METQKIKPFTAFLCKCSGAFLPILEKCPTEIYKYTTVGVILFITAAMASFSGGYFFFSVFDNVLISIFFGCFWGLAIFSLDRFIIISYNPKNKGWLRFYGILPRLLLSICLGVVVAKPLELKLFHKEIEEQIQKENIGNVKSNFFNDQTVIEIDNRLRQIDLELVNASYKLDSAKKEADMREVNYYNERNGVSTVTTTGKIGVGEEAKLKKELWQTSVVNYKSLADLSGQRIKDFEQVRKVLLDQKEKILTEKKSQIDKNNGPLRQLDALHNLVKENFGLRMAGLLISLIFILFEVAPVVSKVTLRVGMYETILEEQTNKLSNETLIHMGFEKYKNNIEGKRLESQYNGDVTRDEQIKNKIRDKNREYDLREIDNQHNIRLQRLEHENSVLNNGDFTPDEQVKKRVWEKNTEYYLKVIDKQHDNRLQRLEDENFVQQVYEKIMKSLSN